MHLFCWLANTSVLLTSLAEVARCKCGPIPLGSEASNYFIAYLILNPHADEDSAFYEVTTRLSVITLQIHSALYSIQTHD